MTTKQAVKFWDSGYIVRDGTSFVCKESIRPRDYEDYIAFNKIHMTVRENGSNVVHNAYDDYQIYGLIRNWIDDFSCPDLSK